MSQQNQHPHEIALVDQKVKTLGFDINVKVPASIEDFDKLAKQTGAALKSAVLNVIYRSVLATFRDTFTEKLAEKTGIERSTKETGKFRTIKSTEEGVADTKEAIVVWAETESDYFDRVVATLVTSEGKTKEEVIASFQSLADSIAAGIAFDPSESAPSSSGPKKIAKQYLDTAQVIINAGKADAVAAALSAKLNKTITSDLEGLARGISEDQALKRKMLASEYTS